jgi:hypothetical protein
LKILLLNALGELWTDEFQLSEKRTSLLPKHLIERPNIIKFKNLMTSERKPILRKLCKFIRYINMISSPIWFFWQSSQFSDFTSEYYSIFPFLYYNIWLPWSTKVDSTPIEFKNLMTSERKPILRKLCKFIRYINMIVCPPV